MPILEVKDLHVYYGAIHALKGLSISVEEGEIVTLIGANGAGKTTLLSALMNQIPRRSGSVSFLGHDTAPMSPPMIVRAGMTMVPEGRRIFPRSSTLDNLRLGAYARKDKAKVKEDLRYVFELFPILEERKNQIAGSLSGGEQQMLSMARALMSSPRILLLDEPSMGLAPMIVSRIFQTIRHINETGVTVVLVEQNANQALHTASRGYVIETGEVVLEDDSANLLDNQRVKEAYLGS